MTKIRKPWLAGLLSFFLPGLGHIYCGKWKKGLALIPAYWIFLYFISIPLLLWLPYPPFNVILFCSMILLSYGAIIYKSVLCARENPLGYQLRQFDNGFAYFLILVLGLFLQSQIADFVRLNIARAYRIPSGSMVSTIAIGDHIFEDKITYHLRTPLRREIVIFPYPEDEAKFFIKRIIGLPGEIIEIRDKMVYIDGEPLFEKSYTQHIDPATFDAQTNARDNLAPQVIPSDSYFVIGDNRDQSLDSRFFGVINEKEISGKAQVIYWSSPNELPFSNIRWERIGHILQ